MRRVHTPDSARQVCAFTKDLCGKQEDAGARQMRHCSLSQITLLQLYCCAGTRMAWATVRELCKLLVGARISLAACC